MYCRKQSTLYTASCCGCTREFWGEFCPRQLPPSGINNTSSMAVLCEDQRASTGSQQATSCDRLVICAGFEALERLIVGDSRLTRPLPIARVLSVYHRVACCSCYGHQWHMQHPRSRPDPADLEYQGNRQVQRYW